MHESVYDYKLPALLGGELDLGDCRGKVLLLVNVASRCGFTPQYAGLEALQRDYAGRGFSVIGFPCNQFGRQEPGTPQQIASFCRSGYRVSFPLSQRIEVNGAAAHPLYRHLKQAAPGSLGSRAVKWNFTKFLVDRKGQVVSRHGPAERPESLRPKIERLLAETLRGG